MVFAHSSSTSDYREDEEQQSGDFQPEHMQHMAYAAERSGASPAKGPYPTILTSLAARNPQKRPAEMLGCHAFYLSLCAAGRVLDIRHRLRETCAVPTGLGLNFHCTQR